MKPKIRAIFLVFFAIFLSGCKANAIPAVAQPPATFPAPITVPVTATPSNLPRWRLYELALSKELLNTDAGLCEWEIWGQSKSAVYVWALCISNQGIRTTASVPAVISLGSNGQIEDVIVPHSGMQYNDDIVKLFPKDLQAKVLVGQETFDGTNYVNHIQERLASGGPPLIALSGTALP